MNKPILGAVIGSTMFLLGAGCEPGASSDSGQHTALLSHPASLPVHRHMDELDRIQRQFLAMQSPGDRLLIGDDRLTEEAGRLRDIQLSDRPLQATRQKRVLNEIMAGVSIGQELQLAERLDEVASRLNESDRFPRCLYLVINPRRQSPPLVDGELWQRDTPLGGWTAFLLVPNADNDDIAERTAWSEQLYLRGAGRVQTVPMDESLPACRE